MKLSFNIRQSSSNLPLDLFYVDISGPLTVNFFYGYRFLLTILDDFSKFTRVYLMKLKPDTRQLLKNFLIWFKLNFIPESKLYNMIMA